MLGCRVIRWRGRALCGCKTKKCPLEGKHSARYAEQYRRTLAPEAYEMQSRRKKELRKKAGGTLNSKAHNECEEHVLVAHEYVAQGSTGGSVERPHRRCHGRADDDVPGTIALLARTKKQEVHGGPTNTQIILGKPTLEVPAASKKSGGAKGWGVGRNAGLYVRKPFGSASLPGKTRTTLPYLILLLPFPGSPLPGHPAPHLFACSADLAPPHRTLPSNTSRCVRASGRRHNAVRPCPLWPPLCDPLLETLGVTVSTCSPSCRPPRA